MDDRIGTFWDNRPALVTGSTGLLGGWLTKKLVAVGADVVCLVRDWVPQSELIRKGLTNRVKMVRGDVRDQALLERILGEYEIDTVFHLAAQTIVGTANRNPISTFDTNIRGTWATLEACRRSPLVRQVVVASSDKAYGTQDRLPYDETTPLNGCHPYDVSKSCADLIARTYAVSYGLNVAITRCGNFFGGGDLNWNRIVPGTIRSVLLNQQPAIRSDGKSIRDYFYIEDAVRAYMLLAKALGSSSKLKGEAFNFSSEFRMTVLDMVEWILERMDSDLRPDIRASSSNEISHQFLDSSKARRELGWAPLFEFEEGLDKTIAWYRSHFETESVLRS